MDLEAEKILSDGNTFSKKSQNFFLRTRSVEKNLPQKRLLATGQLKQPQKGQVTFRRFTKPPLKVINGGNFLPTETETLKKKNKNVSFHGGCQNRL